MYGLKKVMLSKQKFLNINSIKITVNPWLITKKIFVLYER